MHEITDNKQHKDQLAMEIDEDEDEDNKDEHKQCWSEQIMFVETSSKMNELLKQLIDAEDEEKYNWAINYCINKCYNLIRNNPKNENISEWIDPLNNVMVTMANKHNRAQIAFVKLYTKYISQIISMNYLVEYHEN